MCVCLLRLRCVCLYACKSVTKPKSLKPRSDLQGHFIGQCRQEGGGRKKDVKYREGGGVDHIHNMSALAFWCILELQSPFTSHASTLTTVCVVLWGLNLA